MKCDEHGRWIWTPKQLYTLAQTNQFQLINGYLMAGTPRAFPDYTRYCDFLGAVADRLGVHPRNLYLRGSCHIGYSIAPKDTVWTAMRGAPVPSDLDLVIVDEGYFTRFEREVRWWEERNASGFLRGRAAKEFERRQQDRQFNCCRDDLLPVAICVPHQDAMRDLAAMKHCGLHRLLSAFIYPDWLSARRRYEFDIRELISGIEGGRLPPPGDQPVLDQAARAAPATPPV